MPDPRDRLIQCFAAAFPELHGERIPLASMETTAGWDSLAVVTLVALVEEEFGVDVAPTDLERFASFEEILTYLEPRIDA